MADEDDEGGGEGLVDEVVCAEGAPEWVVTFGDMMSLLLTFFILLLSFASMEAVKYKLFSGSVMQAFGVQTVQPAFSKPQGTKALATEFSMNFKSRTLKDGMKQAIERHTARNPSGRIEIRVYEDYRGVVVSLDEDAMFQRGQVDLRPTVWPFLDDVLQVASENNAQIQAAAHTDNSQVQSARFPSNDHLSADRAVAVVRYFRGVKPNVQAGRYEAIAYGATRPKVPNLSVAARRRNRRVELIFYGIPADYRLKE